MLGGGLAGNRGKGSKGDTQVAPSGLELPPTGDAVAGHGASLRAAVARRLVPDSWDSRGLNRIAELAARLLAAPSAQISLLTDVEHVVGGRGLPADWVGSERPLADSFCALTVGQAAPLVVTDAEQDDRVSALPLVVSGHVMAYLGVPLVTDNGHAIGALCVMSPAPREWSSADLEVLDHLATPALAELQLAALSTEYDTNRLVWQLAVDAAGVGAFDWDLTKDQLRWDDRLLELFGYDHESVTPGLESFTARVHPGDLPRVTAALDHAVETCGEYSSEYRVVLPDGGVRWIAAKGRALRGDDGVAERLIGAAYDTTEVHEGEARVGRILEAMSTAFFSLDHEWRFTYVNAEAERVLDVPREQILGGNIWELYPAAIGTDFETHYRRAAESGTTTTFEAHYPNPLDSWYEIRAWPMPDGLFVYFLDITERRDAQAKLERAARRSELLARVSGALTGTLDAEEAVRELTRALVPEMGEWSMVTLIEARASADWRSRLCDLGFWHADPAQLPVLERYNAIKLEAAYDSELVQQVMSEDAETMVFDDTSALIDQVLRPGEARDMIKRLDPGPAISVPLRGRGRLLGMLSLNRKAGQPPFDGHDVDVLEEIGARAGLALDNARLFAEQRDLAEGLQRSMLTEPAGSEGLEIVVRYEPAAEAAQVGGDWYDSFLLRDGVTTVVIGDVVGHDTAAAAAMGQVRGLLRAIAVHTGDGPGGVLQGVDKAMDRLRVGVTATAVVASVERVPEEERQDSTTAKRLCWSNAGHPEPILVTGEGEVVALSAADADLLLGLDSEFERSEHQIDLESGAILLLYTDGLVERRGQGIDEGLARLRDLLRELVAQGFTLDELCDELLARMRPGRREDDVAVVAVRVR
jgi:PAS domain S-box-containing protein